MRGMKRRREATLARADGVVLFKPPLISLTSTTPSAPLIRMLRDILNFVAAVPSSAEEGSCGPKSFVLTRLPFTVASWRFR
jgi:hypothetical protein